ncbi:transcription elongation factor Spt6 [Schizosaccharomyces octosporus yFS286]|uniref:Transcription elongation factor Spt6 n=1 Tax=Schizosaccharomyces octosporus (strain yFS286) TaxID=483514 RepID=S9PXE0_SCHOY|nr:transcription elongation factor Spt6 [Schizosaccharomyces octosporus yFS286]EPX73751.1 transcription elongation factor Spt6 [Schizosaccharomyces octosporus yFS286]
MSELGVSGSPNENPNFEKNNDAPIEDGRDENADELNEEGEGDRLDNNEHHDSSEESETDEEAERAIREGFIVEDEDDEAPQEALKKKKRKKRAEEEKAPQDMLDEDDLELVMENTGQDNRTKLKRLKRGRDQEEDLQKIFSEDEDQEEKEPSEREDGIDEPEHAYGRRNGVMDEFADFIEQDEFEDEEPQEEKYDATPQIESVRPEALGISEDDYIQIYEIFGDGTDYAFALEDEDVEDELQEPVSLKTIFEPSELQEKMLTEEDEIIRITDEPERMQLYMKRNEDCTDQEILDESLWIANRILEKRHDIKTDLLDHFRSAVRHTVHFFVRESLEVPFIWQHRRDYIVHYDRQRDSITPLLNQDDLWCIFNLCTRYWSLHSKKKDLMKLYSDLGISDEMVVTLCQEASTLETVDDLNDYLHFTYSEQIRDRALLVGTGLRRPQVSKYSFYEKAKKSPVYHLVKEFGISARDFSFNAVQGARLRFVEDVSVSPQELATSYVSNDLTDHELVLQRARKVFAEEIVHDPYFRKAFRDKLFQTGIVSTIATQKGVRKIDNEHPYYEFKYLKGKPLASFEKSPILFLKMLKAEEEGLIQLSLDFSDKNTVFNEFFELILSDNYSENATKWNAQREMVLKDVFKQLSTLAPGAIRETLRSKYLDELGMLCRGRLYSRLDQAPYEPSTKNFDRGTIPSVLAVSNGKGEPSDAIICLFVNDMGEPVDSIKLPDFRDPANQVMFTDFVDKVNPDVIGVSGMSVAAHKVRQNVQSALSSHDPVDIVMVNDEIARLYQNSSRATDEFPSFSTTTLYCIALARYVQNPLFEYAALGHDLLSLSFDPWQHLLPSETLWRYLETALVDVSSLVGIDINEAVNNKYEANILPYIAGLGPRKADYILKKIATVGGRIDNRSDLISKQIVTRKIFINCSSFFIIPNDEYPNMDILDTTRIHNEDYELARKMASDALELDEEDIEELEASKGVVYHLLEDNEVAKVDELVLEEYADQLEREFHQRKRSTLEKVRRELKDPYGEQRNTFHKLTPSEIFLMLTGENPRNLGPDTLVPVNVKRVTNRFVAVKLDCDVDGDIKADEVSDDFIPPPQLLQAGQTVEAIIISLNEQNFTAELSLRNSIMQTVQARQKDRSHLTAYWDAEAEDRDNEKMQAETQAEQRVARVIKHPLFKDLNASQAEAYLSKLQVGDLVIRPSSKGSDHIVVTWKVGESSFQHIDVLELDKENEFSIGQRLIVKGRFENMTYQYSDLDELIVMHIKAIAKKIDEMCMHEKYRRGSRAEIEHWLESYSEANPKRSCYTFCSDQDHPGYFVLCFKAGVSSPVLAWPVKVIPNAYFLQGNVYADMTALCNGFKLLYAARAKGSRR